MSVLAIAREVEIYHLLGEGVYESKKYPEIFEVDSINELLPLLRDDVWRHEDTKISIDTRGIWERWKRENPERYKDFIKRAKNLGELWK